MTTLKDKVAAEIATRNLLAENGLPDPDQIEYGETCIRLFWHESKVCFIVDLADFPMEEEPPPRQAV